VCAQREQNSRRRRRVVRRSLGESPPIDVLDVETGPMVGLDKYELELRQRRTKGGENRLPPAAAVVVAIVVYTLLPNQLFFGPRIVVPVVEGALLLALVIANPRRIVRQTRWSRTMSIGLSSIMIFANLIALGLYIDTLTSKTSGTTLLIGGMQVWVTNVIGFGLLFWELDRGGPVKRHTAARNRLPPADWRFSQDENADAVSEVAASASERSGWMPTFLDYLYLSLTNSSAFSPTDTMPLSSRAKVLMGIEATAALLTSLLVVARAIGTITGKS
jgi:hypothetical protein